MAEGKPFSAWLSGDLLKQATLRASAEAAGNESKYVKSLIERDVAASEPGRLLVELARQYHPSAIDKLERAFENRPLDQKLTMMRLIDALVHALEGEGGFQADQPFELIGQKRLAAFRSEYNQSMETLAGLVTEMRQEKMFQRVPKKKENRQSRRRSTPPISSAG